MPEENKIGELEDLIEDAVEDGEANLGIDVTGDGKPDVWLNFKGKVALVIAIVAGVAVVTKIVGLW